MMEVEKFTSGKISDPIEAVRGLISKMCKTHSDNQEDSPSTSKAPTAEDLSAFTEIDIQNFSRQLLENDSLIESNKDLKKSKAQSDAEFLLKVLEAENKKHVAELSGIFSSVSKSLDGLIDSKNSGIRSVSEGLLKQNELLESYFTPKRSIFDTSPDLFRPPNNPVHETNDRLGDMAERLGNLVRFGESALQIMNGLQAAAAEFLENFSEEANKNSKAAKNAILVGVFAILFSVAQIGYTEFWRVPQDTVAMDAALASLRGEIDELQTALGAELASLRAAQANNVTFIAGSINSAGEANAALLQKIDLLLQQQMALDSAMIEALEALSDTARNSTE